MTQVQHITSCTQACPDNKEAGGNIKQKEKRQMEEVLTCGCGCQRWSIGGHYFTCDKCGFIFWAHSIHAMNNLLEKDYKERPKTAQHST